MTGFKSKKAAALDEDGMYLVHHTKRKDDQDDDIQVYKREWVSLTDEELLQLSNKWRIIYGGHVDDFAKEIEAKLKEKNG